jgi:hypothetical protein
MRIGAKTDFLAKGKTLKYTRLGQGKTVLASVPN